MAITNEFPWDPTLGDPIQPASHVLTLNVSRISDFTRCRRMFFLRWILRLTGDESTDTDAAWIGSTTHEALHKLHRPGTHKHHDIDVHDIDVHDHGVHDIESVDPRVGALVRTHTLLCPNDRAEYVAGELEARWLIARKSILLTGRFDALWRHPDGTIEVRDYKTGRCPDSLDHDLGAAIYLLLAANHPATRNHKGELLPLRVVYESLAPAAGRAVSVVATPSLLRGAFNEIVGVAEHIRREKSFPADPSQATCRSCSYRKMCPSSQADPDDG